MASAKEKKAAYLEKFAATFEKNTRALVVTCDNIGSAHMQKIRKQLRGKAVILMGKNTLMRKAIRLNLERNPKWAALLPAIVGNVGIVFTEGDLSEVRDILTSARVPAAAKAGILAPQDVIVPKGQTNLEPTKTSFLQALNIASKINKGTIEIINDVPLVKAGDKVGPSEAQLLQMLDIRPFTYGLSVQSVYDNGAAYGPEVLDLKDSDILDRFASGIANVACVSLGAHIPTVAAFPHVVLNAYKNVLSIALGSDYTYKQAEKLKALLNDPEALKKAQQAAAAAPAPAAAGAKAADTKAAAPAKKEEPKKEEKPESEDMGFDLFG